MWREKFKEERIRGRMYTLWGNYDNNSLPYKVCRNDFINLFGVGKYTMRSIGKSVVERKMLPSPHGLNGKRSNNILNEEIKKSLIFFQWKSLLEEPHASKIIELHTKLVLKDNDDNIELPTKFSKRRMFERWCLDR